MKYTYQISFNSSDYFDLTPSTVEFDGGWITDTKIWRENISTLKITKNQNSAIYDTLETYFEDATYFTTRIFVKVLKSNVQESIHWFGIKWGTLNKELKTYEVEPLAYDYWGIYFGSTKDFPASLDQPFASGLENDPRYYYNITTYFPLWGQVVNEINLDTVVKYLSSENSGWQYNDVVSSILWGSNYEDSSVVGTYRGMMLDYVTGKQSLLEYAGIGLVGNKTFSDLLEYLKLLKIFVFFDSNDKLRFEHISFFNDKLVDNAVDYSAYIENYDEEWSYENTGLPMVEKISTTVDEGVNDVDFRELSIIYNASRNRPDAQTPEYRFSLKTNSGYYAGANITDDLFLYSSVKNALYKWFNTSMSTFSSDFNYVAAAWGDGVNNVMRGNNFLFSLALDYTFTWDHAITGSYEAYVYDTISATTISNTLTISSSSGSDTLTLAAGGSNCYLIIEGVSGSAGSIDGWITLVPDGTSYTLLVPTIDGIASGSPKSNGAFSTANIVNDYWQDDRVSRVGSINGSNYIFDNTQYNLRRKTIKFFHDGLINPLFGFNDGSRIALIEKWTRSPETGFYEIDLIYQEDEAIPVPTGIGTMIVGSTFIIT